MIRINDRVLHIEYPKQKGSVVAKTRKDSGVQFVLVLWDSGGQSRHHPAALRRV
jgi:hypothetical protein